MKRVYIVTGAMGHLGNTIVRALCAKGAAVRCLIMPGDSSPALNGLPVETVTGDIRDFSSVDRLFSGLSQTEIIVIHAAGIVSIATKYDPVLYEVNVGGTRNIIEACRKYCSKRLVYVSSVHAIPEKPQGEVIAEIKEFDPDLVTGAYAKTKAEATMLVLESAKDGLDSVVIHPSGICGPNDYGCGHMTQLVMDFLDGRLKACIRGGFDFVDVRDVAGGILSAADLGKRGDCYILSNRVFQATELLDLLAEISGRKRIKTILPLWLAKATAPLSELWYKLKKQTPLYTGYSLLTLSGNANFSHQKAELELNYKTRDMRDTLFDTVQFLIKTGRLKREVTLSSVR